MKNFLFFLLFVSQFSLFAQNHEYLNKTELQEDLEFFREKLTNIHPLFSDIEYLNKWTKQYSKVKTNIDDSLSLNDFYLKIAPLLAYLNDAHSNFMFPFQPRMNYMMNGDLSFPFSVSINENRLFVEEYYGDDSLLFAGGEEILEINTVPINEILDEMRHLKGSKSLSIIDISTETYFRSFLWMIYNFENGYDLKIKKDNDIIRLELPGIKNDQFIKNKKRYPRETKKTYSLELKNESKSAILRINTFADLNGFCEFADSAFKQIAANNSEQIFIDIRGNTGGRTVVIDSLMNYLTDKEYSLYKSVETRISNELKSYYKENFPEKYKLIESFHVNETKIDSFYKSPRKKKYAFNGKKYLLTDFRTFSGAATFAGIFKEMKLGLIIGEETGGTIEYFGDFMFFQLPNTRLQFVVSPKRFIQYGGEDFDAHVMPDLFIINIDNFILNSYKKN